MMEIKKQFTTEQQFQIWLMLLQSIIQLVGIFMIFAIFEVFN